MYFSQTDLDILKELGNVGAGNAATALSEMLNTEIDISVPTCEMISFSEMGDVVGGPEKVILGILVQILGDLDGFVLMALDVDDAVNTLKILLDQDIASENVTIEDLEPMREVANILVGSYLDAIAYMTEFSVLPSVPEMTIDMAMAIMNVPALVYGEVGEEVLMLDTKFGGKAESIKGHFFLMPTIESYDKLKNALFT